MKLDEVKIFKVQIFIAKISRILKGLTHVFYLKLSDLFKFFLELLAKIASGLIPVGKWRRAFRVWAILRMEYFFEAKAHQEFKNKVMNNGQAKFSALIVNQDLTVTGAPLVLLMTARVLLENGAGVGVAAAKGGGLAGELDKLGVPSLVSQGFRNNASFIRRLAEGFDLIVVNSMPSGAWVDLLPESSPLIWYVHEGLFIARDIQANPQLGRALFKCRHIYMDSDYARSFLPEGVKAEVLPLAVPDVKDLIHSTQPQRGLRLRIAMVATFMELKGQDLILEALGLLTAEQRQKLDFYMIGRHKGEFFQQIRERCPLDWPVTFINELPDQEKKWEFFESMDVFCVPSRYESCSLVVLEAAMLGKPFIISDHVGAKYMLQEWVNGLIFASGEAEGLHRCLEWCLDNRTKLTDMGVQARRAYEEKASWLQFEKNLMTAVGCVMKQSSPVVKCK